MSFVKHEEARRIVAQSVATGAANLVHTSRRFSEDDREHAELLTARAIIAQSRNEPQAWLDVVDGMSRMVFAIACDYFYAWETHLPAQASFDDVFMAGMEGLTIGVRKFDEARGFMISTYATSWIRTKSQRACYAQCGSAQIPERLLQKGLDPLAPLVASATMSLNFRLLDNGMELGESLEGNEAVDTRMESAEGLAAVVAILRSVDEHLPEIAGYIVDGLGDGKIAKLTGLTQTQVGRLRMLAQEALVEHGYAPRSG